MNREHAFLASLAALAAVPAMLLATPPTANANPATCEHRGIAHMQEHGGRMADDAWHVARGEAPNCDEPSERAGSDHNADDTGNHRDRDRGGFNWPGGRDKLGPFR